MDSADRGIRNPQANEPEPNPVSTADNGGSPARLQPFPTVEPDASSSGAIAGSRESTALHYQHLFETAEHGILIVDVETETILDANSCVLKLTGFRKEELVGKRLADVEMSLQVTPPLNLLEAPIAGQETVRYDNVTVAAQGGLLRVDVTASHYLAGSRPTVRLTVRDTAKHRQVSSVLRDSEERFRLFVESVRDYALIQLDQDARIVSWNAGAEHLLGWKQAEAIGQIGEIIFVPEDVAAGMAAREIETAVEHGQSDDNRWHLRKDGSRFFANGVMTKVTDGSGTCIGFTKVMHDMTAQRQVEECLRNSVEEKSALIREIHHRIKNNLQVIVSLLSLQASYGNHPSVTTAFQATEGRVRAIARLHERLYTTDNLEEVDFATYLGQLARDLLVLHAPEPDRVTLTMNVADMVLHIEQAIPLGLIANELVVNAIKHGATGGKGHVRFSLRYLDVPPEGVDQGEQSQEWAELEVTDSGPGLPATFNSNQVSTMGFRLIAILVRQLRGRLSWKNEGGASVRIGFPLTT